MQNIERAIATSRALAEVLDEEVVRARSQHELIRTFDAQGLLERAALRESFNKLVKEMQRELATHLKLVADEYGLTTVSVDSLSQVASEPAARLGESLANVRALAGSLAELDALNRHLAQRANAMVRGYLSALTGNSMTYNQRGEARSAAASTFSGTA